MKAWKYCFEAADMRVIGFCLFVNLIVYLLIIVDAFITGARLQPQ